MVAGLVAGHPDVPHEVGAVPRGRQNALALRGAVQGAVVVRELLALRAGLEPHHGRGGVEHLGQALRQLLGVVVPARALHEHTVDVGAVLGLLAVLPPGHALLLEEHRVDGDLVLARVVLQHAREEGVREVEARDPEHGGRAVVDPVLQHLEAVAELHHVRPQGLERGVALARPQPGDLPVEDGVGELLEVAAHDHEAFDGELEAPDGGVHHADEAVVAHELLAEHGVHALVVVHGVLVVGRLQVERLGHLVADGLRDLAHQLVLPLPAPALALAHGEQDGLEEQVRLPLVLGDVRVLVQPKHLGQRNDRERLDVLEVALVRPLVGRVVLPGGGEGVLLAQGGGVEQPAEDAHQRLAVVGVGAAPAVVALADGIADGLEGHLLGELVDEHEQLPHGDLQVGVGELVLDIPAQGPELDALLHEGVEEAQPEEQLVELLRPLPRAVEELRVVDGVVEVRLHDVCAEPLGRLVGHLDSVLQHGDGEVRARVRGEPQAEVGARVLRGDLLADALQGTHPADRQVAVLEDHPAPRALRVRDHLLRLGALTLPQGQRPHLHPQVVRELEERAHGVGPRGEHEDQRRGGGAVVVAPLQVEGRWLHIALPHGGDDEGRHRRHDLVRAERAQYQQLLEWREPLLPRRGQRHLRRLGAVVDLPELLVVLLEAVAEALEGWEGVEARHLPPQRLVQPPIRGVLAADQGEERGVAGLLPVEVL
mmetsp:Transcript_5662/g.19199  ORF Transcript_5662/g.19199 Transcript_5662/m.19199 type:complete len:711 (+) Transcript_5662:204-2336(+)